MLNIPVILLQLYMDYKHDVTWAKANQKAVTEFFKKLKRKNGKEVDGLFHARHEKVFQQIDCLNCANCCKTTSPIFRDADISRLAKHLKMKPARFVENYLHEDEEGDYVLNVAPCPFLGLDNRCAVYDHRPQACREYPHTNRKKMQQLLKLTALNTQVCPAVSRIVKEMMGGKGGSNEPVAK